MVYRLHDMPPLPLDDPEFTAAVTDLAERVNGFVYDGERLQGALGAVRAMRADPDLADRLLAEFG
jgi:hypothetical protein